MNKRGPTGLLRFGTGHGFASMVGMGTKLCSTCSKTYAVQRLTSEPVRKLKRLGFTGVSLDATIPFRPRDREILSIYYLLSAPEWHRELIAERRDQLLQAVDLQNLNILNRPNKPDDAFQPINTVKRLAKS